LAVHHETSECPAKVRRLERQLVVCTGIVGRPTQTRHLRTQVVVSKRTGECPTKVRRFRTQKGMIYETAERST
jgi:hypothetical protein